MRFCYGFQNSADINR